MAKYILGSLEFNNWKDVQNHCQKLLRTGCRRLNEAETAFILDLLEYHPHGSQRKWNLAYFKIAVPSYGSGDYRCFVAVKKDGRNVDFSYKKCQPLTKKNPQKAKESNAKWDRMKAYRYHIIPQTSDFWESEGYPLSCHQCGDTENLQVDHEAPQFTELVNQFERWFKPEEYPRLGRNNSYWAFHFEDEWYAKCWERFHYQNARLQILCNCCNAGKSGKTKYEPYIGSIEQKLHELDKRISLYN